ncbi:arginine--tRNA ligase [Candidatus Daviesbacteria bacterium]|nr:arginine--tRNA ligase [Candidatus Daviesbacteria bacterium]
MLKKRIEEDLKKAVEDLGYSVTDIVLTSSKNPLFGDYSTNIALQLAKQRSSNDKQSPQEIAKKIIGNLGNLSYLSNLEIAGGGFINFFLKDETLLSNLGSLSNLSLQKKNHEKVMVEFTDPNPFKEFHIGHVFSNAVGESLARLFEARGDVVWRANFFGDVGMHVAKAIYGILNKLKREDLTFRDLEKMPLSERIKFMGQAYVLGAAAYEEDRPKEEMEKLNLLIFVAAQQYWQEAKGWEPRVDYRKHINHIDEEELKEIKNIWITGRKWSLEYFETIYQLLGTKFDGYYPESLTGEWGYNFVLEGLKKGIFETSEGAIIYRGEKHGLHTRVFINKLGLPTYETKDIGNAPHKYSEFKYDKSVIVTANEINEYFKVVIAAMKEVNPDLGRKTIHLGHGVVRLKSGKMSSRTGTVFTLEELFEIVKSKIAALLKDFPDSEKEQTINKVSIGAIKFAMLKHQPEVDTIFDIEKSVALEGDSGPYIQYTYARARSVLRKNLSDLSDSSNLSKLEAEERQILQKIEYFDGVVEEAIQSLHPNIIASYLLELAANFNLFYQKYRILDAGEGKKDFRLSLTNTVANILKQGLFLLGIEAPERM